MSKLKHALPTILWMLTALFALWGLLSWIDPSN